MVEVSWVSFGRIEGGLRVLDGFWMGLHGFWWVLARFWEFWGEKKKNYPGIYTFVPEDMLCSIKISGFK